MGESHPGVSFLQAVIVIGVLAALAMVSFSSGYLTASMRQSQEKMIRAIYLQSLPRSSPF